MTFEFVVTVVFSAIVGGGGLIGIAVYFIKRYINKKLKEEELIAEQFNEYRARKARIELELQRAQNQVLYWMQRAIITDTHNGELTDAFNVLREVERRKDALDCEIIVAYEQKR